MEKIMPNIGGRPWRRVGMRTALTGSALLLAACGSGSKNGNHQASGKSNYDQAIAYSKCMRSHGDPAFPDPNSKGVYVNNGNLDLTSPAYQKAAAACKSLSPSGPDPKQMQQNFAKLLKYSACMRSHGIAKFPDPSMSGGSLVIPIKGTGIDMNSSQFKAADQACQALRPGG
jgi:hypothetical protein